MKIVQSLCSKPAEPLGGWRNHAGHWPHPAFCAFSWALSTNWAFKHYGQVELVTDDEGARWLVDTLKLPFTSVRTDLQNAEFPSFLWAFGKIIAYSIQQEPFFHIDGDVYLTGKMPERYETADIACQGFDLASENPAFEVIYNDNRKVIEQFMPRLPSFWRFMGENSAVNCSMVGGANIDAIGRYTHDVRELVTHSDNQTAWATAPLKQYTNCLIEQQALWCSAREQGISLTPLFESADIADADSFRRKSAATNFYHAGADKSERYAQGIAAHVRAEYPEQFRIIESLFAAKSGG